VRRSRRYKDKPLLSVDLETRPFDIDKRALHDLAKIAVRSSVMTADDQRRRARTGWRNWYINRGRLPLQGDERIERQLSWRRVH
jgi:hypothetical protein